jgi:hypothetical protein
MNKPIALAFVTGGIVLLVLGYRDSQTYNTSLMHLVTNSTNSRATWMMVSGLIALVAGLLGLGRSSK